jgi:hypothetical protein
VSMSPQVVLVPLPRKTGALRRGARIDGIWVFWNDGSNAIPSWYGREQRQRWIRQGGRFYLSAGPPRNWGCRDELVFFTPDLGPGVEAWHGF